jgi:hypothetical protein
MGSRNTKSLADNVSKLSSLFTDIFTEGQALMLSTSKMEEALNLHHQIVEQLIWTPGALIYIEDKKTLQRSKAVMNFVWDSLDPDEIFSDVTAGEYSGLLVNVIGDYIDRAKMLKPTFISINPSHTEFQVYFEEAMKAWLFGLSNSALILCCTIFELLLKEKLSQKDSALVYKSLNGNENKGIQQFSLDKLIKNAYGAKLLDKEDKIIATNLRKLRNNSVHKLESISDKQVYDVLIQTKELIEKLLK